MFGLRLARNSSDTARVEAFSDGVLAIAITLLVLEIHVPEHTEHLGTELRHAWPQYVAYVTAFLNIAVMWSNHHDLFKLIERSDRGLQFFNGVLLMTIAFLPFPTGVLAEHMTDSADNRQAALLAFGGTMVVVALAFNGLWRYIRARDLLYPSIDARAIDAIDRAYFFAPFLYALALPLSYFEWWLSIGLWIALGVFWQFFSYSPEDQAATA